MKKNEYLSNEAARRVNSLFDLAYNSRYLAMVLPCVFVCLPGGIQITGTPVPWWLVAASVGTAVLSGAVFYAASQRQVRRALQEHVVACIKENVAVDSVILDALAD